MLTRKELARRWRDCNRQHGSETSDSDEEEEAWRTSILELLNKAHTLGNFADMSFEVVESNYSVGRSSHMATLIISIDALISRTSRSN